MERQSPQTVDQVGVRQHLHFKKGKKKGPASNIQGELQNAEVNPYQEF